MRLAAVLPAALALAAAPPPSAAFARPRPPALGLGQARRSLPSATALRGGGSSVDTGGATAVVVPTAPIEGMRPGTSGLRKKVEVWMGEGYKENFVQSLVDAAREANGGKGLEA